MSEENKALFRQFIDRVINEKDADAVDDLMDANYIEHNPAPGQAPGVEGIKELINALFTGFPDLTTSLDVLIAEGDLVVGHMTTSGTHKGELMGIPATGKKVSFTETHIVRIANGKGVEHWGNQDDLGMMQQLGVIPTE
jgi:predicted ester cyclase